MMLYKNTKAVVQAADWDTYIFYIVAGDKFQGDKLASYQFIFCPD